MEKKYVSIWFPFLLTDWTCTKQPDYKKLAVVISTTSGGRLIISHCNREAISKGIHIGMVVADARAIESGLIVVNEKPGVADRLLQKIAKWCIRFTPAVSLDSSHGIILDVTGCTHLWGGDEKYLVEIEKRFSEKGYSVLMALAPNPAAARAICRYGHHNKIVSSAELLSTLQPLPIESLEIETETVSMLLRLGLKRIQDIIKLPKTVLRNRFGNLIIQKIEQVTGKEQQILKPESPIQEYEERIQCPELIITRHAIEIALRELIERLCKKLKNQGLGIRKAFFKIFTYDGKEEALDISTCKESVNAIHLFKLFEDKLSSLDPGAGIELFILQAASVEKTLSTQEKLWELSSGVNNSELFELIDKINNRAGTASVSRYVPAEHHWPERSFRKTNDIHELPATSWRDNSRPVELLECPERIEVAAPVPDYPPMHFRYRNKLHKVIKADGPERIEREWWLEGGEHRDYYILEDESGNRFWVFRSGHYTSDNSGQWFLSGYFA